MKNILKLKKNNEVNETEETKEEKEMKVKMSLKKKLAIGGGLLALVAGAVALYNKGKQSTDESYNDDEDENDEDFDTDEVSNEVEDEVNIEG